jgi:hypothetical protein
MPIAIFFRGVAIFVRGSDTSVVEILFPNAEECPPRDTEIGDDGLPQHADHTRATAHIAGVLIPRPTGDEYRKLLNRGVVFPGSTATAIDKEFPNHFPPLRQMTSGSGFGLTLLPKAEREVPKGRVATRIQLAGGKLTWGPDSSVAFNIDGHHAPGNVAIPRKTYTTSAVWTSDAESIDIEVSQFTAPGAPPVRERPITLSAATNSTQAFFYNFDNGLPSTDELVKDEMKNVKCKGRLTDHDFKWVYGLMDFPNPPFTKWQDWLKGHEFPTPWAPCSRVEEAKVSDKALPIPADMMLLPVSTCFQTVVGPEDDPSSKG